MNFERGKRIPKSHVTLQELLGSFTVMKSVAGDSLEESTWTVSIPEGTCTCPSFVLSNMPCKHMFAVFYHYPMWTCDNLPVSVTQSPHILLDASATNSFEKQPSALSCGADYSLDNSSYESYEITNPIPTK